MTESITFTTDDGVELAALSQRAGQKRIAILLHMMPATKESWIPIMRELAGRGYASLAFDQRGHGQSTSGGSLDYHQFTSKQQQAKRLDLDAAMVWASEHGYAEEQVVLMGASIGANLAIRGLAAHKQIPLAVALSPGIDFHGVTTDDAIVDVDDSQRVVLVASDDDKTSWEAIHELYRFNPTVVCIERSGLGHGTRMTDADPSLVQEVLSHLP